METKALEFAVLDVETGLTGSNGNPYIQFSIRQKGDALGKVRKWNFFADEETLTAVENSCPKTLWFADVRVKTPAAYYRRWEQDPGNGQQAGDIVCTKDANGELVPLLFDDIKVLCRWVNATTPSQEDPHQLMIRAWNRGLSRGTIVLEDELDGESGDDDNSAEDFLSRGTSEEVEPGEKEPEKPATKPASQQMRQNNGFRR